MGQVLRVRERKVYIEIFQESMKFVRSSWKNEYYDICFTLNRVPYQLQHYSLEFIEKQQLFKELINNRRYNLKTIEEIKPKDGLK